MDTKNLLDELLSIDDEKDIEILVKSGYSREQAKKILEKEKKELSKPLKKVLVEQRKKRKNYIKKITTELNMKNMEHKFEKLMSRKMSNTQEDELVRSLKKQKL